MDILKQMMLDMARSLQELSPVEQEQTRKAIYESVTGKRYRPISGVNE
jgi:hypothetical protein